MIPIRDGDVPQPRTTSSNVSRVTLLVEPAEQGKRSAFNTATSTITQEKITVIDRPCCCCLLPPLLMEFAVDDDPVIPREEYTALYASLAP